MDSSFIYFSPFEQFIATPILPINLVLIVEQLNLLLFKISPEHMLDITLVPSIDCTITNVTIIFFIIFSAAFLIIKLVKSPTQGTFYAMPTSLESHFHLGYLAIQATLQKHVHVKYYQQVVFPITFALAIFLLLLNLSGNFPIFMSLTSQFAVISAFSLPSIFGIFFLACV